MNNSKEKEIASTPTQPLQSVEELTKAVDALDDMYFNTDKFTNAIKYLFEVNEKVKAQLAAPPVAEEGKWISVKDRLPNLGDTDKWGLVLVTHKSGRRLTAVYDDLSNTVTHWQPLPLAPTNKEEEEKG